MAQSEVPVTEPGGGTTEVPASVVDNPAGTLSYGTTGGGNSPVSNAPAPVLPAALAQAEYPGVVAHIAASEHRETLNDSNSIGRIKDLLKILKAAQDGTLASGKFQEKASPQLKAVLSTVVSRLTGVPTGDQSNINSPQTPVTKALVGQLKKITAGAVRTQYENVGINPGSAANYQSLLNVGGGQLDRLEKESMVARGNTQALEPLTRTKDLMTLLGDLETGKSPDNVNPQVLQGMLARAGVPDGNPGMISDFPRGSLDKALTRVTTQAIQQHMINLGADPSEVQSANSLKALNAVLLPDHLSSMAGSDGYNLTGVTTMGSFFQAMAKQSVRTPGGLGIPGGIVTTPATPAQNGSGQQFFDAFKQQWQSSPAYRASVASALTNAGVTSAPIGDTAADYNAAANALIQVMQKTPSGQNPWAYLGAQPQISQALLHPDPAYAMAAAEAAKLGANLTTWQLNRLAQVYGSSTATGNVAGLDQAIAQLYQYDPNQDTKPGSYAATILQSVQDEFGKYGMTLTPTQAGKYTQQLLNSGGADLTSIYAAGDAAQAFAEDQAKTSAINLFPSLSNIINQGTPLAGNGGILTPYLTTYAQMLGLDPDTVQLNPQLIKLMAKGQTGTSTSVGAAGGGLQGGPGESGSATAPGGLKTMDEFSAAVMQDPSTGWNKSPAAFNAYANMSNTLLSTMGFAPPQGAQQPGPPSNETLAGTGV